VDILALETMPTLSEVLLLLELIKNENISLPVWVSFSATCQQSSTSDTIDSSSFISFTSQPTETSLYTTRHGELITEAVKAINSYPEVVAIGVNCVSPRLITPIIRIIRSLTNKAIIVYPNSGESNLMTFSRLYRRDEYILFWN
jgi:homocysteine S-methyltransferase